MRRALITDRLITFGGAERVNIAIAEALKVDAIITTKYLPDKTYPEFKNFKIIDLNCWQENNPSIFWSALNIIRASFGLMRYKHDFDELICAGMWANLVRKKEGGRKVVYFHSPPRDIYDLRQFFIRKFSKWAKIFPIVYASWREWLDLEKAKEYEEVLANSVNVQRRVKRYYGLSSKVLNPFVECDKFYNKPSKGYFLWVSRFQEMKRPELVVEAFKRMPTKQLVMVGGLVKGYGCIDKVLEEAKGCSNITILQDVSDVELRRLYAECEAVIFTSMFEDFGIIPLEAKASGKPCILCDDAEGGLETCDCTDSVVLKEPYLVNLIKAVKNWDKIKEGLFNPNHIMKRALSWDVKVFKKRLLELWG